MEIFYLQLRTTLFCEPKNYLSGTLLFAVSYIRTRIDTVVERIVYKFSEVILFADNPSFDIKSKCIGYISFEHSLCALQMWVCCQF